MVESIVLGGGCFWCLDAAFRLVDGITSVNSGYAGGTTINPTYLQVCTGKTGHAEVVQLEFNPQKIQLSEVLAIFWAMHDPTTLNYQGNDHGTQYRSIILYSDEKQKLVIDASIKEIAQVWPEPIVTQVKKLEVFYPAEAEHQNYFANHPEQAYCQVIINPKLEKFKKKFVAKLRS